jgi:hypothetical protein
MALLFVDGFDTFGTSNGAAPVGLLQKWSSLAGANHSSDTVITGRFNDGMALRPGSNATTFNHTNVPDFAATVTLVAGLAFRIPSLPTSGQFRELFGTGSGGSAGTTVEVGIAVNDSGGLRVWRGSTGTSLGESSTGLIEANKWYYLELKVASNNSTGSFEARLDGVNVVSASGIDTLNSANPNTIRLFGRTTASGQTIFPEYDDFYCLDTSGSPADFLGPRHIYTIFPSAAGDSTQFTPNTGSNFQAVDDNGHDGNTTYIESNVENNKDLYQFGDLAGVVTDITAAAVYGIVTKTDVSAFDFIGVAKSNGDEADAAGDLVNPSSAGTYEAAAGFFLTDPDTAAAWTQSGINAAQFGLKVGF